MGINIMFFSGSTLLGLGLAMDAFSVSLANGLSDPQMKKTKALSIALVFALFQAAMPLIGWVCVHTAVGYFAVFERFIPWASLFVLTIIGANMIFEGIKGEENVPGNSSLDAASLFFQGLATSIDALSVGFTISGYEPMDAFLCAFIISLVTFFVCLAGVMLGKKFGMKLAGKAQILGGVILIAIGFEIFISRVI